MAKIKPDSSHRAPETIQIQSNVWWLFDIGETIVCIDGKGTGTRLILGDRFKVFDFGKGRGGLFVVVSRYTDYRWWPGRFRRLTPTEVAADIISPNWRARASIFGLATTIREDRNWMLLPVLADELVDEGFVGDEYCDVGILEHLRGDPAAHNKCKHCWVVDGILDAGIDDEMRSLGASIYGGDVVDLTKLSPSYTGDVSGANYSSAQRSLDDFIR